MATVNEIKNTLIKYCTDNMYNYSNPNRKFYSDF